MKNSLIVSLTYDGYLNGRDHVLHHYNWHKSFSDIKVLSRTDKEYNNDDIAIIKKDPKVMWGYGFIDFIEYALTFKEYEYYILLAGDAYIINSDFIELAINEMNEKKVDVLFGIIEDRIEHSKYLFYEKTSELFDIPINNIVWSACNLVISRRESLEYYMSNEKHFEIWPEVGFINCMKSKFNVAETEYVHKPYFSQGNLGFKKYYLHRTNKTIYFVHAIKDYKILKELGFTL